MRSPTVATSPRTPQLPTSPRSRPTRIATVVGRYYAMDRDNRAERTDARAGSDPRGEGEPASEPVAAVLAGYERGVTDEFIEPIVMNGRPRLDPASDAAIFFNFRPDRGRQLARG